MVRTSAAVSPPPWRRVLSVSAATGASIQPSGTIRGAAKNEAQQQVKPAASMPVCNGPVTVNPRSASAWLGDSRHVPTTAPGAPRSVSPAPSRSVSPGPSRTPVGPQVRIWRHGQSADGPSSRSASVTRSRSVSPAPCVLPVVRRYVEPCRINIEGQNAPVAAQQQRSVASSGGYPAVGSSASPFQQQRSVASSGGYPAVGSNASPFRGRTLPTQAVAGVVVRPLSAPRTERSPSQPVSNGGTSATGVSHPPSLMPEFPTLSTGILPEDRASEAEWLAVSGGWSLGAAPGAPASARAAAGRHGLSAPSRGLPKALDLDFGPPRRAVNGVGRASAPVSPTTSPPLSARYSGSRLDSPTPAARSGQPTSQHWSQSTHDSLTSPFSPWIDGNEVAHYDSRGGEDGLRCAHHGPNLALPSRWPWPDGEIAATQDVLKTLQREVRVDETDLRFAASKKSPCAAGSACAAAIACSLSTTSVGSTTSMPRSPCATSSAGTCGPLAPSQEAAAPATRTEQQLAWVQQLLEDAEAVAMSPPKMAAGGHSLSPAALAIAAVGGASGVDGQLAGELTHACAALGHELAILAANLRWADSVVAAVESARAVSPAAGCISTQPDHEAEFGVSDSTKEANSREPQRFYIGDGALAQLLADAEAVA